MIKTICLVQIIYPGKIPKVTSLFFKFAFAKHFHWTFHVYFPFYQNRHLQIISFVKFQWLLPFFQICHAHIVFPCIISNVTSPFFQFAICKYISCCKIYNNTKYFSFPNSKIISFLKFQRLRPFLQNRHFQLFPL